MSHTLGKGSERTHDDKDGNNEIPISKEELRNELTSKIWILQEAANDLDNFLSLHGEKVLDTDELITIGVNVRNIKYKFIKLKEYWAKKINIFNLK